jgi:G3E family GTPase
MMPLVLLAGFLGAGKTHFLSQLLPALGAHGVRPHVVLNDFRNARIDAARLATLNALVTPLEGDCVCCATLTELLDVLRAIPHDPRGAVLVEANGATEADELLGYLALDRQLAHCTPPLQVTVVDVPRWQKRWWHNGLEAAQLRTATHVVLNWEARCGAPRRAQVRQLVGAANPQAEVTTPDAFARTLAGLVAAHGHAPPRHVGTALPVIGAPATPAPAAPAPAHAGGHAHPFAALTLALPPLVDRARFTAFVQQLPRSVVRAKGLVRFADDPHTMWVWNRTEGRRTVTLDPSAPHAGAEPVALCIGARLPEEALAAVVGALGAP